MSKPQRVVILGASNKPDRYSYKAMKLLQEHGHETVLVNRGIPDVEGTPVVNDIGDVAGPVDTLTMYVKEEISSQLADKIIDLKPGRVIFNPGSENNRLKLVLEAAQIPFEEACTLVLLRTGQF